MAPHIIGMDTYSHGSLFAGIGGLDSGLNRQGFKTLWAVEKDRHCQRLLKAKFPDIQIFDDVKNVGADQLAKVDAISYGFCCQDVSSLGLRAGLEKGERTHLFYEAIRIINELRPSITIGENVVGLLSADDGNAMPNIVKAHASIGYHDLCWRVLNARDFGLVQGRRRVFIVSTPSAAHGDIANRPSHRILYQSGSSETLAPQPPPKQNSRMGSGDALEGADFAVICHGPSGLTAYPWESFPTLVTHSRYVFLADKKNQTCRYFTPLEYERLQGFPDGWTDGFPKTVRFHMIGNSVIPAVAEYVAKGCREVLEDSFKRQNIETALAE